MRLGKVNIGDAYARTEEGEPEFLSTREAFVKPLLEMIQRFYAEQGQFIIGSPVESEMFIGGKFTYEKEDWGKKPTVIVARGPIKPTDMNRQRQRQGLDHMTGTHTFHVAYVGQTFIQCIGVDAERIAEEIFDLIVMMPRTIAQAGIFKIIDVSLGEEAKVKNTSIDHLKTCRVSVNIMLEKVWTVTPSEPLLNGVNYNVIYGS